MYTETDLGSGVWQYDYTITNGLDPLSFPETNLYDLVFSFDPSATITVDAVPTNWDSISDIGAVEVFSESVGAPPDGNEVAPSNSLSGFRFIYDYRAGATPFTATFENPSDFSNPISFSGMTSAASPVPEADVRLIFASGSMFLFGFGLKRKFLPVRSG